MKKSDLNNRRYLLENPYAHIEQLESQAEQTPIAEAIRLSRQELQDPYAYLDESGGFSAFQQTRPSRPALHSFEAIERIATGLQRRLWGTRRELWEGELPSPIEVLDVVKAAKLLGFGLEVVDTLGIFVDRAEKVAVAGLIDRSTSSILISRDFSPAVQNFTAAHELGHAMLHAHMQVVHRDRPVDGNALGRERVEMEADKFAAYFLMPAKLLRGEFVDRFLTDQFVLNEDTAFALFAKSLSHAQRGLDTQRKLSRLLASATQYNGRHFYSLAEHFNVTVETMAIRLEELQLVAPDASSL